MWVDDERKVCFMLSVYDMSNLTIVSQNVSITKYEKYHYGLLCLGFIKSPIILRQPTRKFLKSGFERQNISNIDDMFLSLL